MRGLDYIMSKQAILIPAQKSFPLAGLQKYLVRIINIFWALDFRNESYFHHNLLSGLERQSSRSSKRKSALAHM